MRNPSVKMKVFIQITKNLYVYLRFFLVNSVKNELLTIVGFKDFMR